MRLLMTLAVCILAIAVPQEAQAQNSTALCFPWTLTTWKEPQDVWFNGTLECDRDSNPWTLPCQDVNRAGLYYCSYAWFYSPPGGASQVEGRVYPPNHAPFFEFCDYTDLSTPLQIHCTAGNELAQPWAGFEIWCDENNAGDYRAASRGTPTYQPSWEGYWDHIPFSCANGGGYW